MKTAEKRKFKLWCATQVEDLQLWSMLMLLLYLILPGAVGRFMTDGRRDLQKAKLFNNAIQPHFLKSTVVWSYAIQASTVMMYTSQKGHTRTPAILIPENQARIMCFICWGILSWKLLLRSTGRIQKVPYNKKFVSRNFCEFKHARKTFQFCNKVTTYDHTPYKRVVQLLNGNYLET